MDGDYPVTLPFRAAVADYRYLLERRYANPSALKVVGDRYQLDSVQRSMLYRGISRAEAARRRRSRLVERVAGRSLSVDCYNVLYTLANYLFGRQLFLCDDGYLRDSGELHGESEKPESLARALALLFGWLAVELPASVDFYLDSPVSKSGELALELRRRLAEASICGSAATVRSPDHALAALEEGIIATSDSSVIDRAKVGVADLARRVLEASFQTRFISLDGIE